MLEDRLEKIMLGFGVDISNRKYLILAGDNDEPHSALPLDEVAASSAKLFKILAQRGVIAATNKSKAHVLAAVEELKESIILPVATSTGWHGTRFVLGNRVVGFGQMPIATSLRDIDGAMLEKYRAGGTLKKWKRHIAKHCAGNSRLIFALAAAFSGPMLFLTDDVHGGGFAFVGPAETGKTTAVMVAGSVWGCHIGARNEKGFAESWNTTVAKAEQTLQAHNETILILDEVQLVGSAPKSRFEVVRDLVFRVSELTERERMGQGPARTARSFFLSTSNHTMREMARSAGAQFDEALASRIFDIPVGENGLFEDLHGKDGRTLSHDLKNAARRYFGTAGRRFVNRLSLDLFSDEDELRAFVLARQSKYLARVGSLLESKNLRSPDRVTQRFATVYAAGCLARRHKILPFSRKEILRAVCSCHIDGLRRLVGSEPLPAHARLFAYIDKNATLFFDLRSGRLRQAKHKFGSVPGYVSEIDGEMVYFLTSQHLNDIAGRERKALLRELASKGVLLTKPNGGHRLQKRIFVDGSGNKKFRGVYAFRSSSFGRRS